MRTAITCGALALSVMMAGAAEVDTESANYVLPGCKALLAITEGREMLDTSRALVAGYCMGVLKTLPESISRVISAQYNFQRSSRSSR